MATGDRNSDTAVYDAQCDATNPPEAGCSCGWKGDADAAEDHDCSLPDHDELQPIPVIAPEPAVVRIARALATLVEALPDTHYVTVSDHGAITISCKTDEGVRALAASLGRGVREVTADGHRWLDAGTQWVDDQPDDRRLGVSVYGPHRKIAVVAPINESAVTAALSQAEAAL